MSMTPEPERNWFTGSASETDPPEATFDLIGEHVPASRPVGLESLLCALAVTAWACAPAVVVRAWRGGAAMSGATFLPCPTCGAASGEPCRRQDGGDAARSHGTRKKPVTCGTHAGYLRHRSASETACDICKQAQARYMREYRSDPEVYAQTKRENAARAKALWALARRYPDDYHELLREVSA